MAQGSTRTVTLIRLIAASAVLASGIGALILAEGPAKATSYAGSSIPVAILTLAAGFALAAAGLAFSLIRPKQHVGDLAIMAGFLWFAPVWVGWQGGSPLVRSLGMVAAGFTFPLLLHLALAYPNGRLGSSLARFLVVAVYVEAALAALGLALVRDPYFDPGCWSNCTVNRFLIRSLPSLASRIQVVDRWFVVAAACGLAAICAWRLLTGSGHLRRSMLLVAAPAILLAGAIIARPIALHWITIEDPSNRSFLSTFIAGSVAIGLLAGGLAWASSRMRVQRRAVSRTVASLGEAPVPGSLQAALAHALGDPELRIAYWLPNSERFVDPNGMIVDEPTATSGRAVTTLVRGDRPIAMVSHAGTLPDVEREIGPAVRLGLENERLQAETLAHLEEIRASRTRIVETGDAERRRLERNLHDGAQQRLLALSYDIRLARSAAEAAGEAEAEAVLAEAVSEAQTALGDLRQLAHGIFPAILAEAGLEPALETLADSAPLPVEIRESAQGRYPAPVEMAAYMLVSEALEDAAGRRATRAVVATTRDDGLLVVNVEDDGAERTSPMVRVADRIGAVGGTLQLEPTGLQANLPCA